MSKKTEQIELNEEELHIADVICRLFKSGHIKLCVNIEPRHANVGFAQWNATKTIVTIGDNIIELEKEGSVEFIDENN